MTVDNKPTINTKPLVVIAMGVSGSGKTTLAHSLGKRLGIESFDADDFHSEQNKAHMANGRPLTDAMRLPWVQSIRTHLQTLSKQGKSCSLAFSGLRLEHRDILRIPEANICFLYLEGNKELILQRMQARSKHFMPSSLLDSQFEALEVPKEKDVIALNIAQAIEPLVAQAVEALRNRKLTP
ncbi:gluconokinase [Teredinibacter haidensis]|uniref:gluconokinase n=1 Tax=Teredinibacter haidensis TaxID=2731755 RepID=UPI000948F9CC|nr:gluconokinase [Teredinibacter haidensis]